MFIWSCKASSLKFFGFLLLFAVALTAAVFLIPVADAQVIDPVYLTVDASFQGAGDNEGRIAILSQFGWEVEAEARDTAKVTIPAEFDKIFSAYNNIQLAQGLDLAPYRGKEVTRYTYRVQNYPNYEGTVYANLFVHKGRVIGGDVCSADVGGFLHGLSAPLGK